MTILKGGVEGFSYFSLILVILFSNQDHPSTKKLLKKQMVNEYFDLTLKFMQIII